MPRGPTSVRTGGGGGDLESRGPCPGGQAGALSVAEFPRFAEKPGLRTCVWQLSLSVLSRVAPLHGRVALGSRLGVPTVWPGCAPTFKLGLGPRRQGPSIAWGLLGFYLAVVGWCGQGRLGWAAGPFWGPDITRTPEA